MLQFFSASRPRLLGFCGIAASLLWPVSPVRADTPQPGPDFLVTTNDDHNDGTCGTGDCTLREAINAANDGAGIGFAPAVTGTITINNGELVINKAISISGPGADVLTLDAGLTSRVFTIGNGTGTVNISDLTIANGMAPTSGSNGTGMGGCIYFGGNNGIITRCTISGGKAGGQASTTIRFGYGGAIYLAGTSEPQFASRLELDSCTISGNQAAGTTSPLHPVAGGSAFGGAIYVEEALSNQTNGFGNPGQLHATNCTFSGNSAQGGNGGTGGQFARGGDGGNAEAGAIDSYGMVELTACTITNNKATPGHGGSGSSNGNDGTAMAGGIKNGSITNDWFVVTGSLIAGNTSLAPDTSGRFHSQGYNLIGDGDGGQGFNNTGDMKGTAGSEIDPKLGPLADNGGRMKTHALLPLSPALDKSNVTLSSDQRGTPRPYDDRAIGNGPGTANGTDIGAFELSPLRIISTFRSMDGTFILAAAGAPPDDNVTVQSTDSMSKSFGFLDTAHADSSGNVGYGDLRTGLTTQFYRLTVP